MLTVHVTMCAAFHVAVIEWECMLYFTVFGRETQEYLIATKFVLIQSAVQTYIIYSIHTVVSKLYYAF